MLPRFAVTLVGLSLFPVLALAQATCGKQYSPPLQRWKILSLTRDAAHDRIVVRGTLGIVSICLAKGFHEEKIYSRIQRSDTLVRSIPSDFERQWANENHVESEAFVAHLSQRGDSVVILLQAGTIRQGKFVPAARESVVAGSHVWSGIAGIERALSGDGTIEEAYLQPELSPSEYVTRDLYSLETAERSFFQQYGVFTNDVRRLRPILERLVITDQYGLVRLEGLDRGAELYLQVTTDQHGADLVVMREAILSQGADCSLRVSPDAKYRVECLR